MSKLRPWSSLFVVALLLSWLPPFSATGQKPSDVQKDPVVQRADRLITEGRHTFRFDTFGDEDFWGGALRLHDAIAGVNLGGIGPGLTPRIALQLGLKVDVDALPNRDIQRLRRGDVNLDSPATTLALLRS